MKRVCLVCERTSADNNLFCQETYCPAEMSPTILDYGDLFGDIEVVRAITVLRSSVLYEATHQKRRVFMKVAHPGAENTERLKREAEFIRSLQVKNELPATLPHLLPPYPGTTVAADPCGKTMLQGHLLYFYLFEHFDGEPLRDVLMRNPQPWVNHIGWLMISLAATVNLLHLKGLYHYGLSPDSLLVRFDEDPSVPRILLYDLGIAASKDEAGKAWYPFCVPPAYTAPELVSSNNHAKAIVGDYRTDVYGVGLVLYEMLIGEPAYTFKLRADSDVYRAVQRGQRRPMTRTEDVKSVANVALRATDPDITQRQQFAADVALEMKNLFGEVPQKKKRRAPGIRTIYTIIIVLLAIAFLVALAVILAGAGTGVRG